MFKFKLEPVLAEKNPSITSFLCQSVEDRVAFEETLNEMRNIVG